MASEYYEAEIPPIFAPFWILSGRTSAFIPQRAQFVAIQQQDEGNSPTKDDEIGFYSFIFNFLANIL
jgi:hypothetical protein